MAEMKAAGKLAKGAAAPRGSPTDPRLADQGVDKHLADKARKLATSAW